MIITSKTFSAARRFDILVMTLHPCVVFCKPFPCQLLPFPHLGLALITDLAMNFSPQLSNYF